VPTREDFLSAHARLEGSVRALARHHQRDRRQIYRWLTSFGLEAKREP
jgi:transposase-like protein